MDPKISVIMSVYNCELFVADAIESIFGQTFADYEFIIIDDGSTDTTTDILKKYAKKDRRVRLYHQKNMGLITALNRGCKKARGQYIARMDADDISLPERFEKQIGFMDKHPDIGVLGTSIGIIDSEGIEKTTWLPPTSPEYVKWSLIFGSSLAHASTMIRKELMEAAGYYRLKALHIEDYDLWVRLSSLTKLENMQEILYLYRHWGENVCFKHAALQQQNVIRLVLPSLVEPILECKAPEATLTALRQLSKNMPLSEPDQIWPIANLICKLRRAFIIKNSISGETTRKISRDTGERLYALASYANSISPLKGFAILILSLMFKPSRLDKHLIKKIIKLIT